VADGGYLLDNTIYKYKPDGQLSVFKEKSGYEGADIAEWIRGARTCWGDGSPGGSASQFFTPSLPWRGLIFIAETF